MITTARNILREGYEVDPMRGRAGAGREPLTALLLAGGRSSRMGRNKALLSLRPGGPPVIQLIAHKMAEVADEMLLVGCDPRPYAFLGLPCVPDAFPGTGPLGGVYSGLAAARNPYALAVACDMPFLSVDLLKYMASLPRDYDALIPVFERAEPRHAIYAKACLPTMEAALRAGRHSAVGWYGELRIRCVDRLEIERYDPRLRSFFDMNTPEEWTNAGALLRCEVPEGAQAMSERRFAPR